MGWVKSSAVSSPLRDGEGVDLRFFGSGSWTSLSSFSELEDERVRFLDGAGLEDGGVLASPGPESPSFGDEVPELRAPVGAASLGPEPSDAFDFPFEIFIGPAPSNFGILVPSLAEGPVAGK